MTLSRHVANLFISNFSARRALLLDICSNVGISSSNFDIEFVQASMLLSCKDIPAFSSPTSISIFPFLVIMTGFPIAKASSKLVIPNIPEGESESGIKMKRAAL